MPEPTANQPQDDNQDTNPTVTPDAPQITPDSSQEDIDKIVDDTLELPESKPADDNDKGKGDDKNEDDDASGGKPDKDDDGSGDRTPKDGKDDKTPPIGTKEAEPEDDKKPEPKTTKKTESEEDEDKGNASDTVETADLWIEIEDSEGNTHKVGVNDKLPDDFTFKNDAQLADYLESRKEMRDMLNERIAEHEAKSEADQQKQAEAQSQQELMDSWDNEIDTLIEIGSIPEPTAEPGSKDWKNDPGVKKVAEVFDFMAKENEARKADNKPVIRSFGTAFQLMETRLAKEKEEADQKKDNELAKERGGRVGGGSAASGSKAPVYKSGSYNNIFDVPV